MKAAKFKILMISKFVIQQICVVENKKNLPKPIPLNKLKNNKFFLLKSFFQNLIYKHTCEK